MDVYNEVKVMSLAIESNKTIELIYSLTSSVKESSILVALSSSFVCAWLGCTEIESEVLPEGVLDMVAVAAF
jgi:hypothetical protein